MSDILTTTVVHKVRAQFIEKMVNSDNNGKYEPLGLYYAYDEKANRYIGCDNSGGDAWVEEFIYESECVRWLMDLS